jgi:alkanesulfonate monooxygenase SsuD/methylene tetrahydromethanopterin reductase-like flavin-dependent oxidoreductase (luciferase family)
MKFGIFYEHQLPRPWDEHSEYRLLQNSLDQIELADRLGYDYAWEVEHHFLEEYSHSSAPEVFLAAASQRTKTIRLGHGIVQLTTNHPARVAERISTLDLVSGGRVELGIGEGSSVTELHPFDRRFRDKREVWEDAVRAVIPMFGPETLRGRGDAGVPRARRRAPEVEGRRALGRDPARGDRYLAREDAPAAAAPDRDEQVTNSRSKPLSSE